MVITQHALERFMQRRASIKVEKSLNRLMILAERAIRIGKNRWYSQGWILVIKKGEIRTAYRPKTAKDFAQIWKACNSVTSHQDPVHS